LLESSSFEVDISALEEAGHFISSVTACDLEQACSTASFSTFFVSNLRIEDNYRIYNLLGTYSVLSNRGTNLLIIADSFEDDLSNFRKVVSESIRNILIDSEVSDFFKDHFNIFVVEPVTFVGTETSLLDMNLGECSDWSDDIFCWDEAKLKNMKDSLFSEVYIDSIAIFSPLDGRGVTSYDYGLPPTTAQRMDTYGYQTFMHEFGHSHALLGDEYISSDDRGDFSDYEANYSANNTTNSDVYSLKWNHWIEDLTSVPGLDPFAGLSSVGLFEGNYYGETGNYRPKHNTVMNDKSNLRYGEVGSESFAIVSTQNQFGPWLVDFEFLEESEVRSSVKISLKGKYDATKLRIEWYKNSEKVDSLTDQKEVIFTRPTVDEITRYTWKAVDLTGVITVAEDPFDVNDSYEGLFDYRKRFYSWNGTSWDGPFYSPDDLTPYDYGVSIEVLGSSLFINWSLW
ncbi:MAG: M64 family metallopeptidase, partial [SAR86 cluster bacterium]